MPTGYTAKLMEKGQSFDEFVTLCARAMGACILLRDEPFDKPIPERFEPSDWNVKRLAEARETLSLLLAMDNDARIAYGVTRKAEEVARIREYAQRNKAENDRLIAMEQQVNAWEPPSPDHVNFKAFMLEQLKISKHGEYAEESLRSAQDKAPIDYYADVVKGAERDIVYHTKQHSEEVERTEYGNQWLADLRRGLAHTTGS